MKRGLANVLQILRSGAAIHHSSDSDTATTYQGAPNSLGTQGKPKGSVNISKIVHELVAYICGDFIVLIVLNVDIKLLTGYNILVHLLELIRGCLILACICVIPNAIVIMLRIVSPDDTAYEIGSTQDEQTNQMFEQKYTRFKSIADTIIFIAVIMIQIYFSVTAYFAQNPDDMQMLRDFLTEIST